MPSSLSRMQLAQRIHLLLVQEIDHAIEIERLLADPRYARDVLLVCEAIPGGELSALAGLFREASSPGAGSAGRTPQPVDWGRDTSGFGVSQPAPLAGPVSAPAPLPPGGSRRASDSDPAPLAPQHRGRWLPPWRDPKK